MIGSNLVRSIASQVNAVKAAVLAVLAASNGAGLVGFIQAGVGAVVRNLLAKLRDSVDLRDFITGDIDEAADYTDELNAAVAAAAGRVLRLPPNTIRTRGISADLLPMLVGEGPRLSKLVHIDGNATPLIRITGGDVGVAAYPYDGFRDMAFEMGSATTGLIYFDGRVDNQVVFDNLALRGANGPAGSPGLSMRDYCNLRMTRIRWDGIGGWGVEVRNGNVFPNASLSIAHSTYDNEKAGAASWGAGLLSVDCSGLANNQHKGTISLSGIKVELHKQLTAAKPARGLVRIVQTATVTGAQVQLALRDFEFGTGATAPATNANVRDARLVSVNAKDVMLSIDQLTSFGIAEIYNNDTYNAKDAIYAEPNTFTKIARFSSRESQNAIATLTQQDRTSGIRTAVTDSDGNRDAGVYALGDVVHNEKPLNTAGRLGRAFAYKAVQAQNGVCAATPGAIAVTGTTVNGSPTLQLSGAVPSSIYKGVCLTVGGAFTRAKVLDIDYTANTCTMESNAGISLAGQAVSQSQAALMAVEMVWQVSALPARTDVQYRARDRAVNLAASDAYPVQEWACTVNSTLAIDAGTWRAIKWHVVKGTTANRPALTASDVGVTYLDTTLAAAGKPIAWNGANWVDGLGVIV